MSPRSQLMFICEAATFMSIMKRSWKESNISEGKFNFITDKPSILPSITSSLEQRTMSNEEWQYNQIKTDCFMFKWRINNFQLLKHEAGSYIDSSIFRVGEDKVTWCLRLFPGGFNHDSGYVLPVLTLLTPGSAKLDIVVHCELSFIVLDRVIAHSKSIYKFSKNTGLGPSKFIQRAQLITACAPDDSFTIQCKIQRSTTNAKATNDVLSFQLEGHHLGEDCHQLLKEPYPFSDVTIIVGDKKISAHRIFLIARSSVFAAMFAQKDLKGSRTNIIEIGDMEPEVVQAMLEFIYTDQVMNLVPLASGLIVAAHKYDLKRLKMMCQEALYKSLDKDTAGSILVLADKYGSPDLTQAAINFIADHYHEVTESESFKKITDPDLLKKLMHAIATRKV